MFVMCLLIKIYFLNWTSFVVFYIIYHENSYSKRAWTHISFSQLCYSFRRQMRATTIWGDLFRILSGVKYFLMTWRLFLNLVIYHLIRKSRINPLYVTRDFLHSRSNKIMNVKNDSLLNGLVFPVGSQIGFYLKQNYYGTTNTENKI